MTTLCSKCPFFQLAPLLRHKNARKRCRLFPQRPLRIYTCKDFPKKRAFNLQKDSKKIAVNIIRAGLMLKTRRSFKVLVTNTTRGSSIE